MSTAAETTLEGVLQLHPDGFGFVVQDARETPDIFIPANAMGGAMHRDRVEVRVVGGGVPKQRHQRGGSGDRLEGRIVRVVKRGTLTVVGRFAMAGKISTVVPDDARYKNRVAIPDDGTGGAREGQAVAVRLLTFPDDPRGMTGKVIQILGQRGLLATEIDTVMHHHDLPLEFPPEVDAAAEAIAKNSEVRGTRDDRSLRSLGRGTKQPDDDEQRVTSNEQPSSHKDYRHMPFVTIDGETAKDFDDAVLVEPGSSGKDRVWVAIADVSFYVTPDSPIDREALARGTSVYFPDRCLPMLPHVLSDDLCSLRPNTDRLALVASFDVDAHGKITSPRFARAVIQSRARLTYTKVEGIVTKHDAALCEEYAPQVAMLTAMEAVCRRLRAHRMNRGTIDFDLPEPQIVLDMQGAPDAIIRAPRYFSHLMIEELMIAANEVVATHLRDHVGTCVYRSHPAPAPHQMTAFRELLAHLGVMVKLSPKPDSGQLARVVATVRGKPEERLVNHTLLRSMQQAFYTTKDSTHFGLASKCYCHFTSPIRRYPDLLVHRLLVQLITREKSGRTRNAAWLEDLAGHCSRRERVAMQAEREMAKVYQAEFLRQHIGKTFAGIISHVVKFGFFVELIEFFVEGLVPITSLEGDRFKFSPEHLNISAKRTGQTYSLGDRLDVVVHDVKMETREVEFRIAAAPASK